METLTRVLARHVYSLDLSETAAGAAGCERGRSGRRVTAAPAPLPRPAPLHASIPAVSAADGRTPGEGL